MSVVHHTKSPQKDGLVYISEATAGDYYRLLKPRVMTLVVFTGVVGYLLAPQVLPPIMGVFAILALALGAGSAGAMNMYYERDLDARMQRTKERPLPLKKMHPSDALAFAVILSAGSLLMMWMAAGLLAAGLLLFSIFFYTVIYTMWLKPNTSQNIVIGGAAGAFPPVIGWAAASGQLSWDALVLFAIVFFWTPPHFWALALFRRDDYAAVGLPMLPNTHGVETTQRHIFVYTLLLLPLSILPSALGTVSMLYGVIALLLSLGFCWHAYVVLRTDPKESEPAARRLFGYSILYLFALFGALVLDRTVFFLVSMI